MLPRLCLVTDRAQTRGRPLPDVVAEALAAGVRLVQLRDRDLSARERHALASALQALCAAHGARLLVNDRVDIALAVGAAGVHLPADSFDPRDARRLLGPGALIGVSTHSVDEVAAAAAAGADLVVFGPVYDTPAKRRYGPPLGPDALRAAAAVAGSVPIFAIGGMTPERVAAVRAAGAHGVAAVAGLVAAPDVHAAVRAFDAALAAAAA